MSQNLARSFDEGRELVGRMCPSVLLLWEELNIAGGPGRDLVPSRPSSCTSSLQINWGSMANICGTVLVLGKSVAHLNTSHCFAGPSNIRSLRYAT
jgi:hypothetical protein